MNPLNDDELNSLLEQARSNSPEPRPELAVRALRAYQDKVVRPAQWHRNLLRPLSIPWPIGALAAVLLVLLGALIGHGLWRPSMLLEGRALEVPVTREHVVDRNCPCVQEAPLHAADILTFKEFQPVGQIRPRAVGGIR